MENDDTSVVLSSPPTPLSHPQDDSFVWDDASHLYYHSRSGFYHDPSAGWYYSSIDGLYYKFEDGNYVLLDTNKGCQSEIYDYGEFGGNNGENQEEQVAGDHSHVDQHHCSPIKEEDQSNQNVSTIEGQTTEIPPPTSDWLEETLIDMYLSGYKNLEPVADAEEMSFKRDEIGNVDDHKQKDIEEEEEEISWEEENWRAQYGQVISTEEETAPEVSSVDIWDWGIIREPEKEGNIQVARLVGRLVQPSTKLHPSMPSGGSRLRTAPICEVHLDLVRVKSGQVYRLRSPSAGYLKTIAFYDSSNPTKDWGFPELSVEKKIAPSQGNTDSREALHCTQSDKEKTHGYRDRAAERRVLHGGFGIGPGQKKTTVDGSPSSSPPPSSDEAAAEALEMSLGAGSYAQKILKNMGWKDPSSSPPPSSDEAAAEALEMSLGAGSYAQKILKNMGWKEGEAFGRTKQGLTKPLVAVGNKG